MLLRKPKANRPLVQTQRERLEAELLTMRMEIAAMQSAQRIADKLLTLVCESNKSESLEVRLAYRHTTKCDVTAIAQNSLTSQLVLRQFQVSILEQRLLRCDYGPDES